jgi:hypothetical protein
MNIQWGQFPPNLNQLPHLFQAHVLNPNAIPFPQMPHQVPNTFQPPNQIPNPLPNQLPNNFQPPLGNPFPFQPVQPIGNVFGQENPIRRVCLLVHCR